MLRTRALDQRHDCRGKGEQDRTHANPSIPEQTVAQVAGLTIGCLGDCADSVPRGQLLDRLIQAGSSCDTVERRRDDNEYQEKVRHL